MRLDKDNIREKIEKRLKRLPREYSAAFAYRCALRAVPLIGYKGNFDFWKEDKRKDYAFAVIRTIDLSELFLYDKEFISASAATAYATADDAADAAAAATAYASADDADAADAADAAYAADAAVAAYAADAYAANAYAYAAVAAYAAYASYAASASFAVDIKENIFYDLDFLTSTENLFDFLKLPLWRTEPDRWKGILKSFERALSEIGMEYWYRVYEDKISENKPDIEGLRRRIDIPKEILEKGGEAATEYLVSLEKEGAERSKEIKVLFIGEGGAGKTSLIEKIFDINAPLLDTDPTQGIDITLLRVKTEDRESIKAHLWDFGGQIIMHSTHKFFLSERSLYVIVLDGRNDEEPDYWLEHVKLFGGDSPALVVMNKLDKRNYEIERNTLNRKYRNIRGYYKISCNTKESTSGNELSKFIEDLKKMIAESEAWDKDLPKSWFEVKDRLGDIKDDFIHFERFINICEESGIKEENKQDMLIDNLHALGISLYFRKLARFGTHILNPEWITKGVYKIINDELLKEKRGILEIGHLEKIFKGEDERRRYPKQKHDFIMRLMEKFELAYRIDDRNFLIPDLLDKDQPDDFDIKEYEKGLNFRFSFPFFPLSLIPRFIVRMAKHINITDERSRWRKGAILEMKRRYDAKALAIADNRKKIIDIFVTGGDRRDYFTIIREKFLNIFESVSDKFRYSELVPIAKEEDIYEDYKELIGLERMGETEYLCGKLRKRFDLMKLLNGYEPYEKRKERSRREEARERLYMNVHMNPHIETSIRNDISVNIRIKNESIIEFDNILGRLLEEGTPLFENEDDKEKFSREINMVKRAAADIKAEKDNSSAKASRAMNRLGAFMKKLSDKGTRVGRVISGLEKGLDYAQKLARCYDKIAEWCAPLF